METKTGFERKLTNKIAVLKQRYNERARLRWHTNKRKNYASSLPRANVSAWDEMSMCTCSVYVCVCGDGGLQEGGCSRNKRRTFNLHSDWAWRGPVLVMCQHPGGINSLTHLLLPSSPETQADGYDFGYATWTQGAVQNKPAAAQRCLERVEEGATG